MNVNDWIWIGIIVVSALVLLAFAVKTKSFVKSLLSSSLVGLVTLFVLYFTYTFTGFKLEITTANIVLSSVLGLPGVIGLVLLKIML